MSTTYPVQKVIGQLTKTLEQQPIVILQAPPGAGKSTILPLLLLDEPWLNRKKIVMLEPRRLAARSVALRMAKIREEEIGNTIGYRVRFENVVSKEHNIQDLNLHLPENSKIVIVDHKTSNISASIALLERFIVPESGKIVSKKEIILLYAEKSSFWL